MKTKRILSALLAVVMLISLMPTALAAGKTATYPTTTDGYYTVQFTNGDEVLNTQYVKEGDTLAQPATPTIPDGSNEFLGWYAGETAVSFATLTAEELSGWDEDEDYEITVTPKFTENVYVTFYDKEGGNVVATRSTASGGTVEVSDVTVEASEAGQVFDQWKTGDDTTVTDSTIFTKNTALYPSFTTGYSLIFDANGDGASFTDTEYVKSGSVTTKPDNPQRPGYTFDGWYTEAEGGTAFSFGSALSENTTVYAHWTAAEASYTVIFWQQKISDDKDAEDGDKTYDYVSSEVRKATTDSTVSATSTDTSMSYTGFEYSKSDSDVEVKADGSSIVNVYYDRQLITITFKIEKIENKTYKTFTGLYGQTLAQYGYEWPATYTGKNYKWLYNDNKTRTTFLDSFILPTGGTNITYTGSEDKGEKTIYFYKETLDGDWIEANTATGSTAKFTITDKYDGFTAYLYSTDNSTWSSAGTKDTSTGSYDQVSYSDALYIRFSRNSYQIDFVNGTGSAGTVSLKYEASLSEDIAPSEVTYPGNTADAEHYTFGGWYADPSCTVEFDFTGTMPANNLVAYAKWIPETVTVTFNPNDGTLTGDAEQTLSYGAAITDFPTVTREGYTFLGWVDAYGNPWNFASPVTKGMTLIAQWRTESGTLSVKYDSGATDNAAYSDGASAVVKDYSGDKENFIGWQLGDTIYQPGSVIPVNSANDSADGTPDFTVTLTAAFTSSFQIWHSESDVTETVALTNTYTAGSDGTYDITARVGLGCNGDRLYGGYYSSYGENGWESTNAYTTSGLSMTPENGKTYYLKEVSTAYIQPKILYTYDKNSTPNNLLKQIYLVTAVDDQNYACVGYYLDSSTYAESVDNNVYEEITINKKVSWDSDDTTVEQQYKIEDIFTSLESGYLNAQKYNGTVAADESFTFTPFWVTLDGVKVTGVKTRTVNTNNGYCADTSADGSILAISDEEVATTVTGYIDATTTATALSLRSTFTIDWEEDTTEEPAETEPEETEPVETEPTETEPAETEPAETEPAETEPVESEEPEVTEFTITKVDGKKTVDTQTVEAGDQTGNITYPAKSGYLFAGWYTDSSLKTAADFSDVESDMTVYAKYLSERSVKLKVDVKKERSGGSAVTATLTLDGNRYEEVGFTYVCSGEETTVTAASSGRSGATYTAKWSLEDLKSITVTPYWVTLDGTVVYGTAQDFTYRK